MLVAAFVLLTTFVPALRCFGNGYLYSYNAAIPAALVAGFLWAQEDWAPLAIALIAVTLALALALALAAIAIFFRALRRTPTLRVEHELRAALAYLAQQPRGVVMCLPQHWHDVAAYHTGHPVLFGGHGYGFRLLQPVFPRFMEPVGGLIQRHRVRYLVTSEGYLPQRFLDELPPARIERFGSYQLYCFELPGDSLP